MPIPYRLDYVIEEIDRAAKNQEQRLLKDLAGIEVSAGEAHRLLSRITDHKWYVSERLGRDVGLRVAAVDYFANFYEPRSVSSSDRSIVRDVLTKVFRSLRFYVESANQWPV